MATKKTDSPRMSVPKTYKLFIGGKFPRSESGRSFEIKDQKGAFLANASLGSRKDVRDAVLAARKAFPGWSSATAYNRGQVIYRIAEVLDGRREQFVDELIATGSSKRTAQSEVDATINTWVYYAGFADKYAQIIGAANPVAAPYFNFSLPTPQGVVAIVASNDPAWSLRSLAATAAPALIAGNSCVVLASERNPMSAISLAEVMATSDVPSGTINILTGKNEEMLPHLASHMDVNGIDLAGCADRDLAHKMELLSAENLKRVRRARSFRKDHVGSIDDIVDFTELKTVWHPIGV